MEQQPELVGAAEKFLIDDGAGEAAPAAAPADVVAKIGEAAEHAAEALPELIVLSRGGERFPERARLYLDGIIQCLASALEAGLAASRELDKLGIGEQRKGGEDALALMVTDFLDRSAR